jgi:hypothetical protein
MGRYVRNRQELEKSKARRTNSRNYQYDYVHFWNLWEAKRCHDPAKRTGFVLLLTAVLYRVTVKTLNAETSF